MTRRPEKPGKPELRRFFRKEDGDSLGGKVLPEIRVGITAEKARLGRERKILVQTPERGERRPREIHLLNWILTAYLSLPEEERDRLIDWGRGICEERQRSDRPVPFPREGTPYDCGRPPVPPSPAPDPGVVIPRPIGGVIVRDRDKQRGRKGQAAGDHHAAAARD